MEAITFTCKIITPLFMAGADGKTPELRAASIKGALRFWWRASNGHLGLDKLREQEQEIFGGVGPNPANRSKVMVRVIPGDDCKPGDEMTKGLPNHRVKTRHNGDDNKFINILDYLAYGVTDRGRLTRPYFKSGATFQITLRINPSLSLEGKKGVVSALILLGSYGGLGSKSRNGFGSISVDYDGEIDWCKALFQKRPSGLAQGSRVNYTAFSKDAKLYETKLHPSWDAALAELGAAYRGEYPSVGLMKGTKGRLGLDSLHEGYQRKYIAMPLNGGARHSKNDVHERRAKSFFLGISQVKKQYKGRILYLPDTYQHNARSQQANHDKAYSELMKNFSTLTKVSL